MAAMLMVFGSNTTLPTLLFFYFLSGLRVTFTD